MIRAFPNQLNQKEVIQLANSVVPDSSITFESNQHEGQFGDKDHPALFGQSQFQGHQKEGHIQQNYWGGYQQVKPISPHYYCPCSYCQWIAHWYY